MTKTQRVSLGIRRLKASVECLVCGGKDNLTFHHVHPEEKGLNTLGTATVRSRRKGLNGTRRPETTKRELLRTVPLCQTCHNKIHGQYRGSKVMKSQVAEQLEALIQEKLSEFNKTWAGEIAQAFFFEDVGRTSWVH